MARGVKF